MITIRNGVIRLTLNARVGGTITTITHEPSGLSVLGQVPWDAVDAPLAGGAAEDEAEWLTRYTGGWPLLFPNGGDACEVNGILHGFHGEASISPWEASAAASAVSLRRRFATIPVEMRRTISLEGETVIVEEEAVMRGDAPVDVMWGHHPTFGSDLLKGPVEVTSGARRVTVDGDYDPPGNPFRPGAGGTLSALPGKVGDVDAGHPAAPLAALLYLHDFETAWAAIRRLDNAIAVVLEWDKNQFPCAWAWFELEGTGAAPWNGRASLIGLEPNTTRPAYGLKKAAAQGGTLLRLQPGSRHATRLTLRVFRPDGPIGTQRARQGAIPQEEREDLLR